MPVYVDERLHAINCTGCTEWMEIRPHDWLQPDRRTQLIDLFREEHKPCDEFKDAQQAQMARKHRKRMLRLPKYNQRCTV